ncbi:MAG: phosphatase PAP2 family protein [Candidatus Omnitrophota bacterium]
MADFDIWFFHFFNSVIKNPFLDIVMPPITILGDRKFAFPLCLLSWIIWRKDKKRLAAILVISLLLTVGSVDLLKYLINRPRPGEALSGIFVMGQVGAGFSFPSAQAAVAFVLASVFSSAYKKLTIALFILATLVGISRIYLGLHYPSDVIIGAVVGIAVTYIVSKMLDKFNRI